MVPRLVSITGTREDTGLGAESVPVDVFVGPCDNSEPEKPDSAPPPDGGAEPENIEAACADGLTRLDRVQEAAMQLHPDRGCTAITSRRLSCTLDPTGTALFGISGGALELSPGLSGFVPVCVLPRRQHPEPGIQLKAIPRLGSSRVAAVAVAAELAAPPPSADCSALRSCDAIHAVPVAVGLVSVDKPTESVDVDDFGTAMRSVGLDVQVETLQNSGGDSPRLSTSPSCADNLMEAPDAGSPSRALHVQLVGGQSTVAFWLCIPGYKATYRLTVSAPATDGIESRSKDVEIDGLVHGITTLGSGTLRQLLVQRCGEDATPASLDELFVGGDVTSSGTAISVDQALCNSQQPASPDAGPPDAGAGACTDARLVLKSAHQCTLRGAWQ